MAVTAKDIKELRELTGVGMLECKNVLAETDGNIEKAIELLRERGLAAAAKKAGRVATEGLCTSVVLDGGETAVLVEVNSETDFVAKNQAFVDYVAEVTEHIAKSSATDTETLSTEKWLHDSSVTVAEALSQKIAVIGENLTIRRFEKLTKKANTTFVPYVHGGGKVAVLVELETTASDVEEVGKNICMQIAAMSPQFLDESEISPEFIEKEKEILTQQALNEGKPANIVEKMVTGGLKKALKGYCLLNQEYVKAENKETVADYLANVSKEIGTEVKLTKFIRFETGEGLEKKEENFAEEVNKAMQG